MAIGRNALAAMNVMGQAPDEEVAKMPVTQAMLKVPTEQQAAQAPASGSQASTVTPGSAGVTAAASLLGGLLANQAAQQTQMRELQSASEKMAAEEAAKARAQAQQSQQNAFTRLMGSFRSALT